MKHLKPDSAQASSPKLAPNPASTGMGITVWKLAILVYLAAQHLLHDDARHVQYQESVRQAQEGTPNVGRGQRPFEKNHKRQSFSHSNTSQDRDRPLVYGDETVSQRDAAALPHMAPTQTAPRAHSWNNHHASHNATGNRLRNDGLELSRAQMSDAWVRMRAVSPRRVEPTTMNAPSGGGITNKKARKHVRWGPVQTHEYTYQHEADDEEEARNPQDGEAKFDRAENKHAQETRDGKVEMEREIWTAVETGGEHEVWGSTADNEF